MGPMIGVLPVLEMDEASYYNSCLQKNSTEHDSTGTRVYTACHVLCRFIAQYTNLFNNKRVCEIGCGVGIAGIVACTSTELSHMVLTDGNEEVVGIARQNLSNAGLSSPDSSGQRRASAQQYSWGDPSPGAATGGFDLVMGSELTYYSTDMTLLVATVLRLLSEGREGLEGGSGSGGLFVHAHIFRKQDQELELIELLAAVGWDTAEVAVTSLLSPKEQGEQGSMWCGVRCLVSGPRATIAALIATDPSASFFVFQQQSPLDIEDRDEGRAMQGAGVVIAGEESFGLGALFA
eukprot:CAMPEP_0114431794 /NCGR_PEP_ID=MMETSP0103-20121206/10802_1 /TAXON_ID=37642 ORGANISM="Paraphysomonas imperforata, Strain PA2" /NCGR_SAMPLE_ID=MMETSP0103 /ASSEMBLY_ACC=CAM_ASM_000201 /LENGTH=291 /DNA_ID=CAMNT_0001601407 /DNA_START=119 /DNA_END=994 /DNA_ORIENTATION=-